MQPYTENFYKNQKEDSRRSAREIIPLILELIVPKSVIDIGCGVGTWLSVFKEHGVDIWGVDGDYMDQTLLEIPPEQFLPFDLKQPFNLQRKFDLVVSLEVAEHLPPECAESFVCSLTELGSVVLFSAAIPFQGGTHHVNEQWPEYWIKYFEKKNFVAIDCIRKRIWNIDAVSWWYAQNIFLFVRRNHLENQPLLQRELDLARRDPPSIIHPKNYLRIVEWKQYEESNLRQLLLLVKNLSELIPAKESFILVDENQLDVSILADRYHVIPFLEKDGEFWGPPPNDEVAIKELERLRQSGVTFIVFGWPAFWWLDTYSEFNQYLHSQFRCVLKNDCLIVFDLFTKE